MSEEIFKNPISEFIWKDKYKAKDDKTIDDTWKRVARALANVEPKGKEQWFRQFKWALEDFKVLPGGRILANAGLKTRHSSTLVNCFVAPEIEDSMENIYESAKNAALTLKSGGGIGFDFSKIRPAGATIDGINQGQASGPVSFMQIFDKTCKIVMAGNRRGAMIGVLRIDHPDIEEFIGCKDGTDFLSSMNLSVGITDKFMQAVEANEEFDLVFKQKVYKRVNARDLFNRITKHTYEYSEPGVIFLDTVNNMNNLYYTETIAASNPCGEQMLPPGGACNLISINLTQVVTAAFEPEATMDFDLLEKLTRIAVRMADNTIDITNYPLDLYKESADATRRIGLGITGLANMLTMLGTPYNSHDAHRTVDTVMRFIRDAAYEESIELAKVKGAFPKWTSKYADGAFIKKLPTNIQADIREFGIRNSHLLSIQPTGTVSLLANNISSGLEPIFALSFTRKVKNHDGEDEVFDLRDFAYHAAQKVWGKAKIDKVFMTSSNLTVDDHIQVQSLIQEHVDSSISKTINVPTGYPYSDFENVYWSAWREGLKGITTFRPTEKLKGIIIDDSVMEKKPVHKLDLERGYQLRGTTYKIKDPRAIHAYYITINDREGQPWEIFFNSKSEENDQFVKALSVTLTEIFKRADSPEFIANALKMISDTSGGFWDGGKYYRSLVARIGEVILDHIGRNENGEVEAKSPVNAAPEGMDVSLLTTCPACKEKAVIKSEGCEACTQCTYSRC